MPKYAIILLLSFFLACSSRIEYQTTYPPDEKDSGTVNINTATVDELERLPHIGRKTAEAIVGFREVNGRFRRPEHLLLIRGVSESRFVELRPLISVD